MEFDRIYAEVDLGRIEENMKAMKEHLRPGTKMYGVVKTDAYGHGAVPVARTIDRFVCGCIQDLCGQSGKAFRSG